MSGEVPEQQIVAIHLTHPRDFWRMFWFREKFPNNQWRPEDIHTESKRASSRAIKVN